MRIWALSLVFMNSGLAAQDASPKQQCSNELLTGRYIFTGRGYIEPIEPSVERVHYGLLEFDGHGNLTGKQSSSRGGRIGHEDLAGTYVIKADCTGTLTFRHVARPGADTYGPGVDTHWDMYVTSDGRKGNIIRTDAGTMAVRSFEK